VGIKVQKLKSRFNIIAYCDVRIKIHVFGDVMLVHSWGFRSCGVRCCIFEWFPTLGAFITMDYVVQC